MEGSGSPLTALQLVITLDQPVTLEFRQAIDPEYAIELIDFVLQADGQETGRFFCLRYARKVLKANPNGSGPLNLVRSAWHRNTALLVPDGFSRKPFDLRIDVGSSWLAPIQFENDNAVQNADVWRSYAYSRRRSHCLQEVVDQQTEIIPKLRNGFSTRTERRMRIFEDWTYCQNLHLSNGARVAHQQRH